MLLKKLSRMSLCLHFGSQIHCFPDNDSIYSSREIALLSNKLNFFSQTFWNFSPDYPHFYKKLAGTPQLKASVYIVHFPDATHQAYLYI